jgi:hypothetical protein
MLMKLALRLARKGTGCIVFLTRYGRFFIRIKVAELMQWKKWTFYRTTPACCVMTTGNRISLIFACMHLCNAHDLRELERVYEQDGQRWAKNMKNLLLEMNELTKENDGALPEDKSKPLMKRYRTLLTKGSNECSENVALASKKDRSSQSKSRNLLRNEYETISGF